MSSMAFVGSVPVLKHRFSSQVQTCTFLGRHSVLSTVATRRASFKMSADSNREDGYVIRESEFHDPETEDDSGDGFMGEAAMDDMLGVAMPEDLASFEIKEIQASRTRDELVSKLKDIAVRRRDIIDDRRKGMGMDNVDNYLKNL